VNKVAIIGTGNIGTDLGERLLKSDDFELVAVIGRREGSPGVERFQGRVKLVGVNGLIPELENLEDIDVFFDATTALDHAIHWDHLKKTEKWIIDLTPSKIGQPMVPLLIGKHPLMQLSSSAHANYSMVTCGGQSAASIIFHLSQIVDNLFEIEISSSIASRSAGPATRKNIDQYISSTEALISNITGCRNTKAILVLNPAIPPVYMRTTITMKVDNISIEAARLIVESQESKMQEFVPGFRIITMPIELGKGIISMTVGVEGSGYFLPSFAGNLDIINSAAVETARLHVQHKLFTGGKHG